MVSSQDTIGHLPLHVVLVAGAWYSFTHLSGQSIYLLCWVRFPLIGQFDFSVLCLSSLRCRKESQGSCGFSVLIVITEVMLHFNNEFSCCDISKQIVVSNVSLRVFPTRRTILHPVRATQGQVLYKVNKYPVDPIAITVLCTVQPISMDRFTI